MDKQGYRLPVKQGDPVRVLRMYTVEGLRRPKIRLNEGSEGVFVKMEIPPQPSAALVDQLGVGAYTTPRFIVTFPEGPVLLEEGDFQFRYVERPMDVRNLLRSPAAMPGATPEALQQQREDRRDEIRNLRRVEQRYSMDSRQVAANDQAALLGLRGFLNSFGTQGTATKLKNLGGDKIQILTPGRGHEDESPEERAAAIVEMFAMPYYSLKKNREEVQRHGWSAGHSYQLQLARFDSVTAHGDVLVFHRVPDRAMPGHTAKLVSRQEALLKKYLETGGVSHQKGEATNLRQAIQHVAAQYPETRAHLVPLLRKYAGDDIVACTCPDGGKAAAEDELMGGRTWGNPDSHSRPDDNTPYNRHEDSPPAGADGSPQRKKYNEWFRKNVCPKHKTNCGAPWLK